MRNSGKKPAADDEVEQLLRAAQDDVLLKLNINSHMSRAGAAIDPDLDRRFEALKNPPKPAPINDPTKKVPSKPATGAAGNSAGAAADDDLFARFTALKSSLPSHSNQEVKEEDESEEDEVEKVIKWAIDAARLDPSLPSDDDDYDDQSSDDDDHSDEDSAGKSKRK